MEMSLSAADKQALAGMIAAELAEPLLYSVAAAAKLLDLSEPSIRRLVKDGKLHPFTGHGLDRTQFTRSELERFVAGEPASESETAAASPRSFRLVGVEGGELTYEGREWVAAVTDHLASVFAALEGEIPTTPETTQ